MRIYRRPVALVAVLIVALMVVIKPVAKWVDLRWGGGTLKDMWGQMRWHEDWSTAVPLPDNLDVTWLGNSQRPVRIAHALGASGSISANTLAALPLAARDGFHLFEVDLWLDSAGELRCEHEDQTATPLRESDCTLARLLPRVAALGGWVVLDIKSEFAPAGRAVLQLVKSNGLASRVVFQLYRAEQLALFASWTREVPLAEPIVTTYASHRSAQHIADHAQSLGIRVLTLPLADLPMLKRRPDRLALMVHPVHGCADWRNAQKERIDGIYTLTNLDCGPWAQSRP